MSTTGETHMASFDSPLAELVGMVSTLERTLLGTLSTALSEENATVDHWRVLHAIDSLDAPTMGELASATGLPNATLSRTVDYLEDSANAYRLPGSSDRRRITVHLSDRGSDWLRRIRSIVSAWEDATQERLGDDVTRDLRSSLRAGLDAISTPNHGARVS